MASSSSVAKHTKQRAQRAAARRSGVLAGNATELGSVTIDRLLLAASEEFGSNGYEGASIEGIARRAGAGKMTVYRRFRDKHALFHALVKRSTNQIQVGLDFLSGDARKPELVLLDAARRIQEASRVPANLQLLRMVIGESQRFPELARELLSMHEASTRPLQAYFADLMASGIAVRGDADVLARMFYRMAVETYRTLLGVVDERKARGTQADLQRTSVEVFLRGVLKRSRSDNSGSRA